MERLWVRYLRANSEAKADFIDWALCEFNRLTVDMEEALVSGDVNKATRKAMEKQAVELLVHPVKKADAVERERIDHARRTSASNRAH